MSRRFVSLSFRCLSASMSSLAPASVSLLLPLLERVGAALSSSDDEMLLSSLLVAVVISPRRLRLDKGAEPIEDEICALVKAS